MAFVHGSKAKLYAGGYDLTGYLRQVSVAAKAGTAETTTLGKTSKSYIPGLKDATLKARGLFDGAVAAVDAVLSAALAAADTVFTWLPQGDGTGTGGVGMTADETGYDIETPAENVAAVTIEAQSTVGRERIITQHALGAETTTANGTSLNNGAASTSGGAAYLQATDPGTVGVTVKVQHSADNVTFVDLVTMTAVASAGRATERKAIAGTINQYTRSTWTPGGAGTTPPFHLGLARF